MSTRTFVMVLMLIFSAQFSFGQGNLDSVEFDKIKSRKIRNLIKQQSENIDNFSDLTVSVDATAELEDYLYYEKNYFIKQDPEEVWYNYIHSNQTEVWDISRISFGLIYCRDTDSITYFDESLTELSKNRIYYINLKILNGLYHLPVSFEITNIDPVDKRIEFSYLSGGKARGKQLIHFSETPEGYTSITHQTYVKSQSKIRDKYLYPYFHNKLITEFHVNMKRLIVSRAKRRSDLMAERK
jgi:hypothetical protein